MVRITVEPRSRNKKREQYRAKYFENGTDEPFFQVMEAQPRMLEEACEVLLKMVISDPESTKNVALFIEVDLH